MSVKVGTLTSVTTVLHIMMLLIKVDLGPSDFVCFTQKKEPSIAYLVKETNMTDSFNMKNITSVTITSVAPPLSSLPLPSL